MSEIYLIRHGQASFGEGDYDVLSETGMKQSDILGSHLAEAGISFDSAYTGTLERQKKTAAIILGRLNEAGLGSPEPVTEPGFNEYDTKEIIRSMMGEIIRDDPSFEEDFKKIFRERRSFQRILEESMKRWIGKRHPEGIETWEGFLGRVRGAVKRVADENGRGKKIAVFASGGSIGAAAGLAAGMSGEETMNLIWQMPNTSVTRLRFGGGRITLGSFNCYSHLERKDHRDLITYR